MKALALLLSAASPGEAPVADAYPLAAVLTEARNACSFRELSAVSDQAAPDGWTRFTPEPNDWFAEYVARNSEGGGGMQITPFTFTKTVAGRTLVAFVARLRLSFAPDAPGFSCDVFDPGAPPIALKAITAWARRTPKRSSGKEREFVFAKWEPGLGRGIDETTIISMPASGAAASAAAHHGLRYSAVSTSRKR